MLSVATAFDLDLLGGSLFKNDCQYYNFINTTDEFSGCGSSYFQHPKRIKLPYIYNFPSKFLVFVTQQQHKHTKKQEDPTLDLPIQTSLNMCK